MAAPRLLAFDTSTETLAVALQPGGGEARTAHEAGGARASSRLLPLAAELLAGAGIGYADLDFVAFGRGPGAFTGLRTACAAAQGIGLATGRPLLAIDSLLIVADDARAQAVGDAAAGSGWAVGVAMDARMGQAYAAVYRWSPRAGWLTLQPPALLAPAELSAAWAGAALDAVAGSAPVAMGEAVQWPSAARRIDAESDRAGSLLRLALQAAAAGAGVDAAQALPLYLRDKVAQTTAEREQAAAQRAAAGPA